MADALRANSEEVDALVSHVLALRMDFVQDLLRRHQIPFSGLRKVDLRDRLRKAIREKKLTVDQVIDFLDEKEPGGKQHVFVLKPTGAYNQKWADLDAIRRSLRRRKAVREYVDARVPVLIPSELALSAVRLGDDLVEVVAVEARRYNERDENYDREERSAAGETVHLHAFVEHVARSTVTLRWNVKRGQAALHITQASGRGLAPDHYREVRRRFADVVSPWLDFDEFEDVRMRRVLNKLQQAESGGGPAKTRSRQGAWSPPGGGELAVTSPGAQTSAFAIPELQQGSAAISSPSSGLSGNLYWLASSDGSTPLNEELHTRIIASDSRVHFMHPSSVDAVEYVIDEIRRLL